MAVLQLFITPDELDAVLKELAVARGLRACRYEGGMFSLLATVPPSIFEEGKVMSRLFLFPPEAACDDQAQERRRPREMGWIDVTPGQIVGSGQRRILTISTLQAEDRSGLPFRPASWLRGLRRGFGREYGFGARGTNVVHGGTREYREIGYSPKAVELHRQGVLWKQYPDDNSEFEPLCPSQGKIGPP